MAFDVFELVRLTEKAPLEFKYLKNKIGTIVEIESQKDGIYWVEFADGNGETILTETFYGHELESVYD